MAAPPFVGRKRELGLLAEHLGVVHREGRGRLVCLRGRRQVGKSRLVSELLRAADVPHFFFTGSLQSTLTADLLRFVEDASREGTIPGLSELAGASFNGWEAALRAVAAVVDRPAALVLDEFPWLLRNDAGLEGTVQKLWDRVLEEKPVLLLLVGSDLSMMAALTEHGRPLYGRAKELVLRPFDLGETSEMLEGAPARDVIDAQLVCGGYPRLVEERRRSASTGVFVERELQDENTDLVVVAQRVLSAEFPTHVQARDVLGVIGSGERTHKAIAQRTGFVPSVLARSLDTLTAGGLVARDLPTSIPPSREPRYRVADPYLRFWFHIIEPVIPEVARGRPDLAVGYYREAWPAFCGRAVEPIVRQAVLLAGRDHPGLAGTGAVGGYWTRTGGVEVDLVGVDRPRKPRTVTLVGSVKWRRTGRFSRGDRDLAARARALVPGAEKAKLVGVSRTGFSRGLELDAMLTPADLVGAFRA